MPRVTMSVRIPKRIQVQRLWREAVLRGWIKDVELGRWKRRNLRSRLLLLTKMHAQRGKCGICGVPFMEEWPHMITLDHVIPKSKGGGDGAPNRQAAYLWCDQTKGDRMP